MERMTFSIRIAPGHEDDIRSTAEDFNAAFEEFVASRRELGLTSLSAWLQVGAEGGPLLTFHVEGDLERYFEAIRTDSGIDGYIRQKLREWAESEGDPAGMYDFPQSEELFSWKLET